MDKREITILIAEDHQMFRKGIVSVLNNKEGLSVIGEAGDGEKIVALAEHVKADVILMDVHLPGLTGVEATRKILAHQPQVKILGLSSETDIEEVLSLIRAGAKGYVLKDTTIEELILAIQALACGSSYFSSRVSLKLFSKLNPSAEAKRLQGKKEKKRLTGRESEILKFIAEELTNKEIANRLFISPRTVETHRRNLIQKLKVKNTAGLVKYYLNLDRKVRV